MASKWWNTLLTNPTLDNLNLIQYINKINKFVYNGDVIRTKYSNFPQLSEELKLICLITSSDVFPKDAKSVIETENNILKRTVYVQYSNELVKNNTKTEANFIKTIAEYLKIDLTNEINFDAITTAQDCLNAYVLLFFRAASDPELPELKGKCLILLQVLQTTYCKMIQKVDDTFEEHSYGPAIYLWMQQQILPEDSVKPSEIEALDLSKPLEELQEAINTQENDKNSTEKISKLKNKVQNLINKYNEIKQKGEPQKA